jgi:PEP-CTERM motif
MTKRTIYAAAISALAALAAPSAQAKYVAIFQEIGANVEEVGGGTLDTTDLILDGATTNNPGLVPQTATFHSGVFGEALEYRGISGPNNFGVGGFAAPNSSSGDAVGLLGEFTELIVPGHYNSGDPLSETSTYLNATFASLGMTQGTYVWTWGDGDHADTFTIQIGEVPEPSTWAMMLLGFAGLGYAAVRRRGAVRAIPAGTD